MFWRYRLRPASRMEYVSPSAEVLLGYRLLKFYQEPNLLIELVHPDDRVALREALHHPPRGIPALPIRWRARDGRLVPTLVRLFPALNRAGRPVVIEALVEVEQEAAPAARWLGAEEFFTLSLDLLCVAGTDGYLKRVNPAWERTLGWSQAELTDRPYLDLVHPEDRERTAHEARRLERELETVAFENRYRCKDGTYKWLLWKSQAVPERGLIYAVARDITDRKDAEQVLAQTVNGEVRLRKAAEASAAEAARRYRDVFESAPLGICQTTEDGDILTANSTLARMLGYSSEQELRARRMSEMYVRGEDRERLVSALKETGTASGMEFQWRRRDGSPLWVLVDATAVHESTGEIRYYQAFVRDITREKLLEEQFLQAQKMEAVGRLAGGVAHDFNNLLTVIIGTADLMLEALEPESPLREDLAQIRDASQRAAGLTRQLLTVSRRQVVEPVLLDVNAVVADLAAMLRRLIGEDVQLRTVASPVLGLIKADRGQVEQVLMNLVINARDAMPKGGTITIATDMAVLDREYAERHMGVPPGRYVVLSVSDTGHGMDAETQRHMFEPFFTTKEKGKGTGLGLSTVYGIVKQSNGHIWAYSEPDVGTTFKIYFPVAEETAESRPSAVRRGPATGGRETILVVEDDAGIRQIVRRALAGAGYTVLEAQSAAQARDVAGTYPGAIHLVLTDVVLPDAYGVEIGNLVRAKRSDCKLLYMSGYTDDTMAYHGVLESGSPFLEKPFSGEALVRKVREVLGG
jgi:PAS domain S-box-containing protein